MRRILPLVLLVAVLALVPSAAAGTLFVLKGKGWGHGVGMSQWGAYGLAKQGKTFRQILAHYYQGTTVEPQAGRKIGVLLADGRTSLTVGAAAALKANDSVRPTVTFPAGTLTVKKTSGGKIRAGGKKFTSPVTFSSTAPIELGSTRYRGKIVVSIVGGALRAVNRLGLEDYVKGVVPRESPDSWGNVGAQAALEAQAVAARSYALASGGHCGGGLFCAGTSDQVYGGYDAEVVSPNSTDAVKATAGLVVKYAGSVATTFFHSSSGGRTAASADVWVSNLPYLVSVKDPADLNVDNHHRSWRELRSAAKIRSQLGLGRTPTDGTVTRDGSGRVETLTMSGPGWTTPVSLPDDTLRYRLGVDSTRFWLGVLRLSRSDGRVEWGERVKLSALVRELGSVKLARRPYRGSWTDIQEVADTASVNQRPRIKTSYRLGTAAYGVTVLVRVEPRLRFRDSQSATALSGIMRPRRAGTEILVQRKSSGSWRTVATTTLAGDGTWKASFAVSPGTYRAYAAPGNGLAPGTSPALKLVAR